MLNRKVEKLGGIFDSDSWLKELEDLKQKSADPEFWNDSKKAEQVMQRIRAKKVWVTKFDDCNTSVEDLGVLFEFMKAGGSYAIVFGKKLQSFASETLGTELKSIFVS